MAAAQSRIEIPAGDFLSGDPARPTFVSAFAIAKHPVTVAELTPFVATGYRTRSLWSKQGWAWKQRESIDKPRFWGEAEWAPYLAPNHPVVGVSAYEAEAFAKFIGARLPTEAEWEKSARGLDGRKFPWGDKWIEGASGRRGVGPRSTVPIGTYPRGESPFGLLDVVGCVWQWCADVVDKDARRARRDPFLDPDEYEDGADRATRGGGWNNLEWNLTTTSCNAYPPGARFSNLGFRLAW